MTIIKNKIKDIRVNLELTQESLAEKVGVTRQTIISIEKGVYAPSITLAILICKVFNKKVEDVFQISKK